MAIWAVVAALWITRELGRRGIKTPFIWFRFYVLKNLDRYKEVTRKETGKIGILYYHYIIPINAALVLAIIALIIYLISG
jgi:hypothetical protein